MTDYSTSLAEPEAPEYSTQLDAPRPSDETVKTQEPAEEPKAPPTKESRLDTIKRAAEEVAPKKEEPATKEPEAKEEKPAAEEAKAEPEPAPKQAPPENERGKAHIEPPSKFLPRAKELWINTPREVKAEVARVTAEAESEIQRHSEAAREYEPLREYAEMARKGGTDLKTALDRYVGMETALRDNPTQGFRGLLDNMGLRPEQAIGHVLAAYGLNPAQLVQHITGNPGAYAVQQGQPQQQPRENQEVAALRQQMEQMQARLHSDNIERDVIAPFAAEHPRYYELQEPIANLLQSNMIPQSLSIHDRLAAAYDMAVRIHSPSKQYAPAPESQEPVTTEAGRAGTDFGGNKSVRGAPASGVETTSKVRGKLSRTDALKAAMAELGIAS
jgi:hypothetical protein